MATFSIYRPKGEALGFRVTTDTRDQMIESIDILNCLDLKIKAFEVCPNDGAVVTYTNNTGGFTQTLSLIPGFIVYHENGLPCTMSKASWESKGKYFDDTGEMYEEIERFTALRLSGNDPEKLRQAIEWCNEIGEHLDAYGMRDDGTNWVMISGDESEPFGSSDYLIFNNNRVEVHTKESLKGEGFMFENPDEI